jgi:transcriptional regulator of acetoin/glycerol metabolism
MNIDEALDAILTQHEQITSAERQRDELIRKAVEGGVRVVTIAAVLGLTRTRIYQIIAKTPGA